MHQAGQGCNDELPAVFYSFEFGERNMAIGIITVAAGYLLGSIPTGLLIVRLTTGRDVRQIGSGRTGGTNVLRAAGAWATAATVILDTAKGFLAVWLARATVGTPAIEALAGLAAVVGHNYSVFIGFKGGAGTMTTIGSAVALWPWIGPILIGVGGLALIITRYASVGSIVVAVLLPVAFAMRAWLGDGPWSHLIHGVGTAALTLWALRPNIRRLWEGQERRLGARKEKSPPPGP